jgi:cyanophycinase
VAGSNAATGRPHLAPGPLALIGGGEFEPGNEPQDRLLIAAATGGPAFVVPTAAARQGPEAAVRNARRWFTGLGLDVQELRVLRRSEAMSDQIAERAATGRFFYLVGGDPGLLNKTLRGSTVWFAIRDAWRAGAALAGSSAGAMVMGEWLLLRAGWPDRTRRRYEPALGLVPGTAVLPHFASFGRSWLASALHAPPGGLRALLGLDEATAAVWTSHDGWVAMGRGSGAVIDRDGSEHGFRPTGPVDELTQPG